MTIDKINFDLTGVPHTLLFPLLGRAMVSQDKKSSFHDARAINLIQSLNYDFDNLLQKMESFSSSMSWAGDRALYFDNEVKKYIETFPNATIVNLGAGLETAFYRVDNGHLTWVDLDVPEVISLRKKLLPPQKRMHYISKSIFDYTWMDEVKKFGNDIFFFAAGLFVYLNPEQVKSLFIEMASRFHQAELVFDTMSKNDLAVANEMFKKFGMLDVKLQWGMEEKEVEAWSPTIKVIYHIPYSQHIDVNFDKSRPFTGYMTKIRF